MYPSFTSTTFQLPSSHYITLGDSMIFNELLQHEPLFYDDHINHNANNIVVHEELSSPHIRTSLESAMGKCIDPNGNIDAFKKPKTSGKSRRASKSDRHSKVNTAKGPRDRRMRLSVDVSKKFFRLQDLLGFDKASKTVEWLLMKSQSCIQELMILHGISISESSASKYGLWSEYIDGDQSAKGSSSSNRKGKKKTRRGVRTRSYLLRPCAKETREMARKRARERTLEKSSKQLASVSGGDDQFNSMFTPSLDLTTDQGVDCFGSWMISQPEITLQNEGELPMTSGWNSSFLFNYQQTGLHPQEDRLCDSKGDSGAACCPLAHHLNHHFSDFNSDTWKFMGAQELG